MLSREELEAVFNILIERPFKEVAPLIGRIQQEYAALPVPDPGPEAAPVSTAETAPVSTAETAPVIDINTGNIAA